MSIITIEVAIEDLESLMDGGDGYRLENVTCDENDLGKLVDTEYYFGIPTLKKGAKYALSTDPDNWIKHKIPTGWATEIKKRQKVKEKEGAKYENQIADAVRLGAVSIDEQKYQEMIRGHEASVGLEFKLKSSSFATFGTSGGSEISERTDCYEAENGDRVYIDGYVSLPYYPYPTREYLLQKEAEWWVLVNLTRPKLKMSVSAYLKEKEKEKEAKKKALDKAISLSKQLESQLLAVGGTKDVRTQDTRVKLFGRTVWTDYGDLVQSLVVTLETPSGGWREMYVGVDINDALAAFETAISLAKAETKILPSGMPKPQKRSKVATC